MTVLGTAARRIRRTYFLLIFGNTLASSFIWGINTLFLLDAGLSNFEAFAANAFFTVGTVLFEVPTGVIADTVGRRASYLLGTLVLAGSTVLYWVLWTASAPFWMWAIVSVLLGLGFTFFSGAVEAWLVDALRASDDDGPLDPVFARGLVVTGVALLTGSVAGGVIAQLTDLGVPFLLRAGVLLLTFVLAFVVMRDIGFTPDRSERPVRAMRTILRASVRHGLGTPAVRWFMLSAPFSAGALGFVFYALQPYLLELWGDERAYGVAGLAAAVLAGSQIIGGVIAAPARRLFRRRTTLIILTTAVGAVLLVLLGLAQTFWVALALLVVWAIVAALGGPVGQAYVNDLVPSKQRATVLSFRSLLGGVGGVAVQPPLGRAADVWGYPASLAISGAISALALPFLVTSRRRRPAADTAGAAADTASGSA